MIYLDNAATSWPKPPEVIEKVKEVFVEAGANPGRGGHMMARKAAEEIRQTRCSLAGLFNIKDPDRIIFTFNATDSLNIALKGILQPGDHVVTSVLSHNSVLRPLRKLESQGVQTSIVPTGYNGIIDPGEIEKALRPNTRLVVLTHASNVLGTIQPVEQVGEICKNKGILFLVDAAQTAGLLPLDVERLNCSMLAFPGHKGLLGPQGIGGLYVAEGVELNTMREGGTGSLSELDRQPDIMPDRQESGTLNTPGIAGLGAGIRFIQSIGLKNIYRHEMELTKLFISGLCQLERVEVYGSQRPEDKVGVVSLRVQGYDSHEVAAILDSEFAVAVRGGLHCAPLIHRSLDTAREGLVRFSFSCFSEKEEVEEVLTILREIV